MLAKAMVPTKAGFRFGAAVITKDDKIFTACNVESSVDALASSAERTAILKAATEGHCEFLGIAIASDATLVDDILPGGTARQFLSEFGDFDVYTVNVAGERTRFTTYELFPSAQRKPPSTPMRNRQTRMQRARQSKAGQSGGVSGRGGHAIVVKFTLSEQLRQRFSLLLDLSALLIGREYGLQRCHVRGLDLAVNEVRVDMIGKLDKPVADRR